MMVTVLIGYTKIVVIFPAGKHQQEQRWMLCLLPRGFVSRPGILPGCPLPGHLQIHHDGNIIGIGFLKELPCSKESDQEEKQCTACEYEDLQAYLLFFIFHLIR